MLLLLACAAPNPEPTPSAATLPALVVPAPVLLEEGEGCFVLDDAASVSADPGAEEVAEQLAAELRASTGFALPVASSGTIRLVLDDAEDPEGYVLDIDGSGVTIRASDADGLYWGAQTFRQLLPPEAVSSTVVAGVDWVTPVAHVEDAPSYPERGLMLDVARHFFTVDEVERQVDVMALHKLNRLHVHLTDDQGWRIEILSWPDLATIGGATEVGGGSGGYYTQAEFLALVDYAAARHVTVVPEIDFPGHANAALASYAELNESGVAADPYAGTSVISTPLWLAGPDTARFVADVWGEVSGLAPTAEVHIGGDEAVDVSDADYAAFLVDLQGTLADSGVTVTGWDEIGGVGLSAPYTAQWWWHGDAVADAVDEGATVLSSPADHAYFDMVYDGHAEFGQSWAGPIDLHTAWDWEPTPPGVDESVVIGVEGALWTEYIDSVERMDFMLWPRSAALAEVGWSQPGGDWDDFAERVAWDGARLDALGIGYYATREVDWAP